MPFMVRAIYNWINIIKESWRIWLINWNDSIIRILSACNLSIQLNNSMQSDRHAFTMQFILWQLHPCAMVYCICPQSLMRSQGFGTIELKLGRSTTVMPAFVWLPLCCILIWSKYATVFIANFCWPFPSICLVPRVQFNSHGSGCYSRIFHM